MGADIQQLIDQHQAAADALADAEHDALDELSAAKDEARRYPDDPEAKARKQAAAEAVAALRAVQRAGRDTHTIGGDVFVATDGPVG